MKPPKAPPGRPRSFCDQRALDQALEVFWQRGYEGASLSDLTAAMGISRPSLYAAFGNKEALFRRVLDRYLEKVVVFGARALEQPTARGAVEVLFRDMAEMLADPKRPRGCMVVQAALACGEAASSVKQELIARRVAGREAWRKRFQRAQAEGDLRREVDAGDLARYVTTVTAGMVIEAVNGATRAELLRLAETALRVWPGLEGATAGRKRKSVRTPAR